MFHMLPKWLMWMKRIRAKQPAATGPRRALGLVVGISVVAAAGTVGLATADRGRPAWAEAGPAGGTPPGAAAVVVAPGQTLTGLAAAHATTVAELAALNGITDPDLIYAGQRLLVPAPAWLPALARAVPARAALVPVLRRWSAFYGVRPSLLEALTWWESGWQNGVVSPTGAVGVGQLEPATVDQVRVLLGDSALSAYRASDNIRMSAAFLAHLLARTGGDEAAAVAAYYQGLASFERSGPLPETSHYVRGILAYERLFGA
jgi:soluble lytic murein transglycosylase-like protein